MGLLKIKTNIPCVYIEIFDHNIQLLDIKQNSSRNPTPWQPGPEESIYEIIEIKLKPGIYKLRLSLPISNATEPMEYETRYLATVVEGKLFEILDESSTVEVDFSAKFTFKD